MSNNTKPIVVYVSRYQDEDSEGKFARFVDSYKKHSAGHEHELFIIKKGFQEYEETWDTWTQQLDGIPFQVRAYPDRHFVFGYVRNLMEEFPDRYILVCTTTSEIRVDGWLELFMRHATPKRILGSAGAYESESSKRNRLPSMTLKNILRSSRKTRKRWLCDILGIQQTYNFGGADELYGFRDIHEFPNPYIRTCGFLIPPGFLEAIYYWPESEMIQTKVDEHYFEYGRFGLSFQALYCGYELLVVGANGTAYPMSEWKSSQTFRTGKNQNLIIADHLCGAYLAAEPEMQKALETGDWHFDEKKDIAQCFEALLSRKARSAWHRRYKNIAIHVAESKSFHELCIKANSAKGGIFG